ncbi:MAG: tRNA epoxyqueuosine(34) reductase QueG [Bacteroidales bacterium]|jgi:epoxyqueuosine reductase|nr:tRNA epoxyqueuosine(34) reductase QueG [Bacteroidales bacterium]MDD3273272.1 tRNA epoxyqueuosine(34) reductase QueG [Bacteroidales bacterium]MDD4057882.1 tRNA epoxyqueuosine(34) reductase QueG [Bacteroidales bacterium]
MTPEQIDNLIRELSEKEGFADYGAASYDKLTKDRRVLEEHNQKGYSADMHYLKKNLNLREDPQLLLDGARSVLCFLAPYKPSLTQTGSFPLIASYAYGLDYHKIVKDKLYRICHSLKDKISDIKFRVFCDSAPVFERAWAVRAGLGFIGKNSFLISKKCGLHTIIGIVLLDREVLYGTPLKEACGKCTKCIDACPSGALVSPKNLDARRCISYMTIESKRVKSEEELQISKNGWFFGCDICLNACPWSSKGSVTSWKEFTPLLHGSSRRIITETTKEEWLAMDYEYFEDWFSDSPLKRAGLNKIKDNIE